MAHVLNSLWLVALGFTVAALTGVPLGLLMGWSRRAEALINPVFLIIRPIPPLAWIPLAILWLGLGDGAKVLVIWFAAFVPSVINAYLMVQGQASVSTTTVMSGMIAIGLVGLALDVALRAAERAILRRRGLEA